MVWPSEKKTVNRENWYNAYGLTYRPDFKKVLWITVVDDDQQIEIWDNETRLFEALRVLDGGALNPSLPSYFGFHQAGELFSTATYSGARHLVGWSGIGAGAVSSKGAVGLTGGDVRTVTTTDGSEFACCATYTYPLVDGYIWDGTALTLLDTNSAVPGQGTGKNWQIAGFIADADNNIWAHGGGADVAADYHMFWKVVSDGEVVLNGEYHEVQVSGIRGGNSVTGEGFYSNGALIIHTGSGVNNYVCRISMASWTETHALATSPYNQSIIEWAMAWTPHNASEFFISNSKFSSADLSLIATYDFPNWGYAAITIFDAVYDPLNNALFVSFTDGDIGWLFFPEPPNRKHVDSAILRIPPNAFTETASAMRRPTDLTPSPFTFENVADAELNTPYISNEITVRNLGRNVSAPVVIIGGEFSKNSGAYTSTPTTAVNGDKFKLKETSSTENLDPVEVTFGVGTRSANWIITTKAPVGVEAIVNIFGDLSASLDSLGQPAAYVSTTGTEIVAGNDLGYFTVAGGKLYVTPDGDAANLVGGPFTLVMDDDSVHQIEVQANTYSVSTQAEWDRVINLGFATLGGKTIRVRRLPGNAVYVSGTGSGTKLRRGTYAGGLTIQGDDRSDIPDGEDHDSASSLPIFDKFSLNGVKNVTIEYVDTDVNSTANKFTITHSDTWPCDGIDISRNRIRGGPALDPHADLSGGPGTGANQFPNGQGIVTLIGSSTTLGSIVANDNHITWCSRGINTYNGTSLQTSGNRAAYCYNDGIQANYVNGCGKWTAVDNCVSHPMGRSDEGVHWDAIRALAGPAGGSDWEVQIERNIVFHGDSRGTIQNIFFSDFPATTYFTGSIKGNVLVADSTHTLTVSTAKDIEIFNNTCLGQLDGADYESQVCLPKIANTGDGGGVVFNNNLCESLASIAAGVSQTGNVAVTHDDKAAYLVRVAGPDFNPQTRAEVLTQYETVLGAVGAVGTGAVTFASVCPGHDGVTHV